jgi:hypothetical protein
MSIIGIHTLHEFVTPALIIAYKAAKANYIEIINLVKNTVPIPEVEEKIEIESYNNIKVYLQYTSDKDKEYIREAAKLKDGDEAEKLGWVFIGSGCFKKAYQKGDIVVKFNSLDNNNMHMLKELILYKEANKKYKKHLARIFGGDGTRIIQRFVKVKNTYFSNKDNRKMVEIAKSLGIGDYCSGHNVVKDVNDMIVFYDFSGHCLNNV